MTSFSLHASKTHFQVQFRGFSIPDLDIWHDGGNRGDWLMYDTEIENKASVDHLWWRHYSFQTCFKQTKTYIFWVLWPITVKFGICGHILLLIGNIVSKWEKTRHGSRNDDVINLKGMIEGCTFSSILQVLWLAALKLGILGSFMLLMTNNYRFVAKKKNTSIDCV